MKRALKRVGRGLAVLAFACAMTIGGVQVVLASGDHCVPGESMYCPTSDCSYWCGHNPGHCNQVTHCCICAFNQ